MVISNVRVKHMPKKLNKRKRYVVWVEFDRKEKVMRLKLFRLCIRNGRLTC